MRDSDRIYRAPLPPVSHTRVKKESADAEEGSQRHTRARTVSKAFTFRPFSQTHPFERFARPTHRDPLVRSNILSVTVVKGCTASFE